MACRCAPCLVLLRDEINQRFPTRDKASDGCCGDAAHAARKSDHNPTGGYAHALDIDEDLASDIHSLDWLRVLIFEHPERYPQVKYLIYEGEIWYPHDGARRRGKYAYTGPNSHSKHLHVSIFTTHTRYTGPWLVTPEPPKQEDDDMAVRLAMLDTGGAVFQIYPGSKQWVVNEPHAAYLGLDLTKVEKHDRNWSGWNLPTVGLQPEGWKETGAP